MLMSSVHDPSLNRTVGECVNTTMVSVQQDHHGAACTLSNSRLQCDAAADAVPHMVYYELPNCTGAQYNFPVEQCTPQVRLSCCLHSGRVRFKCFAALLVADAARWLCDAADVPSCG